MKMCARGMAGAHPGKDCSSTAQRTRDVDDHAARQTARRAVFDIRPYSEKVAR